MKRTLFLVLAATTAAATLLAQAPAPAVRVPPVPLTPEQKAILAADFALPADQPSVKIDSATTYAGKPNPNFGNPQERFLSLHETFLKRRKQPMDALFIGDSITEAWQTVGAAVWKPAFADSCNAANFGISGDRTQHVLWRIRNGELDGITPKAVVLLIGTNNTAHNTPPEIAAGVAKIVEQIHAKIPTTKVLLVNLLPRSPRPTDVRRRTAMQTNELLAKLHNGKDVIFLKAWDQFLDENGTLSPAVMPDALHPGEKGYEILAGIIKSALAKIH